MGKYMRSKCRGAAGEEVAAVEVTQVVGVRTRSRSAAATGGGVSKVTPRRKKALAPVTGEPPAAAVGAGGGGDGGSCYIHLRSRMLFMAPPQHPTPTEAAGAAGQQHGAALAAAGLSRCSSTASSVDIVGGLHKMSHAFRSSDAAEVGGDHVPDVSANNSGSGGGPAADRERRETTPSSRAHGELSDLESDLAEHKTTGRSLPAPTPAAEPIVPPAQEIEAFFVAAEAAHAKRFASKYNFDFVHGVPLNGAGRFEWTPVVSI